MTQGQWGTGSLAVPDYLESVRSSIQAVADLLILYLEVINQVLDFAKTLVKAYLDPIETLVSLILEEIRAILRDLSQIGIYLTGDLALASWPMEDLRGGFGAYEQRMIARLTDRTDPTRPDVSSRTTTLGFFAYMSVDPSDIERLLQFLVNISNLFGVTFLPSASSLPTPRISGVYYGSDAPAVFSTFQFTTLGKSLTGGTPPSLARLSWKLASPANNHPLAPLPNIGPSGFLVTISTMEDGLKLRYARPSSRDRHTPKGGSKPVQPREHGNILGKDLQPAVLYGGVEMLAIHGTPFEYNAAMLEGSPRDGFAQVFGFINPANTSIPLEMLGPPSPTPGTPGDGRGHEFLLQRTFLLEGASVISQWIAGEYSAVFALEDMPQRARFVPNQDGALIPIAEGPASTYYARVWSVGASVADGTLSPRWDFEGNVSINAYSSGTPFVTDYQCGAPALSAPSPTRSITFPNAHTAEYLHALRTAILVLVLSRSDLPLLDEVAPSKGKNTAIQYGQGVWQAQNLALLPTGMEHARALISILLPDLQSLSSPGQNPNVWATALYTRIQRLAQNIYERTGTIPHLEQVVVEASEVLRTTTWSAVLSASIGLASGGVDSRQFLLDVWGRVENERPLFEALAPSSPMSQQTQYGIAPTMTSIGIPPSNVDRLLMSPFGVVDREGEFLLWDGGSLELVYAETDPSAVTLLLHTSPPGLRALYEQFLQEDGSLQIPDDVRDYLEALRAHPRVTSSGDNTPVFYFGRSQLLDVSIGEELDGAAVSFLRGSLRRVPGLYAQAAQVLTASTAAMTRPPQDGEWVALRLFDAFPGLESFLLLIENWMSSVSASIRSLSETIIKHIEFLQAQIVEIQQLIRKINALLQSFLQFSFAIPSFSGLVLVSDGTEGLVGDFVTAQDKPFDSPLSYGGGIALVAPSAPAFLLDLIRVLQGTPDTNGTLETSRPPSQESTPPADIDVL